MKEVIEIYDQLDIRAITESLAEEHIRIALNHLEKVGVKKERKEEITKVAASLIGREK